MTAAETGTASAAWRATVDQAREPGRGAGHEPGEGTEPGDTKPSASTEPAEQWIDHGAVRDEATEAVARGAQPPRPARRGRDGAAPARRGTTRPPAGGKPRKEPAAGREEAGETSPHLGDVTAQSAARLTERLKEAARAFERERFVDARRILRPLAQRFPGAAAVRELYGLTSYRLGRWRDAIRELEAFRTLTGSSDQHAVLADSYRALGRYAEVEGLWHELREQSPSAELVAEGRIVAAGALADQDRLADAIRLLEPAVRPVRHARPHHLRLAYALADLYERAGEIPRARQLFGRVAAGDPDLADVQERLQALR